MTDDGGVSDGPKRVGAERTSATGSYAGIVRTGIPLGLEQLLQHLATPIYLVFLMHMASSMIEVGALFSYMMPTLVVISAPITSLTTLANVYAVNADNIKHLRTYGFAIGGAASLLAALLAFSPLGDVVFGSLMGVPAEEYQTTILALKIAMPLPILWAMQKLAMGVLIRTGHPWKVLSSRVLRVVLGVVVLWVGIELDLLPGAPLGALAILVSLTSQNLYLVSQAVFARHELQRHPVQKVPTTLRELARVGIPLSLTPLIMAATPFMLSAALGRLPGVVLSLATWPIVSSLSGVSLCFGNALSQTAIVHAIDRPARSRLWRVFVLTGLAMMGINVLLLVTGGYRWVFETIESLDPATAGITEEVMWLLTPWFFLYTVTGFYWGMLSRMHLTRPGMYGAILKLLVFAALFGLAITLDPVTGVYVAAAASLLGSVAILIWLHRAYHHALADGVA